MCPNVENESLYFKRGLGLGPLLYKLDMEKIFFIFFYPNN